MRGLPSSSICRTPALEKTSASFWTVAFGGRFVTQTPVFLGADGAGAGLEVTCAAGALEVFEV